MKKVITLFLVMLLLISAAGCRSSSGAQDSAETRDTTPAQTTGPVLTGIHAGHKSGDRFPKTIMLEGMEESVMAEHYVSRSGEYCMDYFYEDFTLEQASNGEDLLWRGLDGGDILGYLSIRVTPGLKAEDQAELISVRMGADAQDSTFAGFDTFVIAGYAGDSHVTYYVFDTPRGCVEIEMACIIEGLEGIGARMHAMLATFEILP